MHAFYISLLLELLNEHGINEQQLFQDAEVKRAGIAKLLHDQNHTLKAGELDAVFLAAIRLSGDKLLGLKMGAKINTVPHGILGYAIITSATIGEGLRILLRYHRALLPSINIELATEGSRLAVLPTAPKVSLELQRLYSEVLYGAIITTGRILVGQQIPSYSEFSPFALELNYNAPEQPDIYTDVFGPDVEFDADRSALCIEELVLGVPISTSNHLAQEVFRKECDRLLPHDSSNGVVSDQVQRVLLESRQEFPKCAQVAKKLHMSESTLRRHLSREGWRFQSLLDETRCNLAREYLLETRLPIAEIASLLGFSDSANFRRSFKRWTKQTPSELRTRTGPSTAPS